LPFVSGPVAGNAIFDLTVPSGAGHHRRPRLREQASRRQVLGGIALRVVSANDLHKSGDGRREVVVDSASKGDDHGP
jgi:hypothetical protein